MRRALAVLATAAALAPDARRAPRLTPPAGRGGLASAPRESATPHATSRRPWRPTLAGAALAAALSLAPPAGARPPSPSVWQASYADQLHPGCERKISIEKNGDRVIAHFAGAGAASLKLNNDDEASRRRRNNNAGTDVGPKGIGDKVFLACSPDNVEKYKLRTWAFDGEIVGDRIDAGDGVHAGTWNVNFKGAENPWTGIRWKDGNRWLKLEEE